jgi:hypothetical protein
LQSSSSLTLEMDDIGLKMGTKEEAFWTEVKERTEKDIEALQNALKFNFKVLQMALKEIESEQALRETQEVEDEVKEN